MVGCLLPKDLTSALRVADLALEDLADDNARLTETLTSLQLSHDIYRQMLLIALELLWQQNAIADARRGYLAESTSPSNAPTP